MIPTHSAWTQTFSGQALDLLNPQPEQILIEDIARGLSHVNRFSGQTDEPFSVAQHSLLVMMLLKNAGRASKVQLQGLLHDATEAYLTDVPKPLKDLLPEYERIEARLNAVIMAKFGLPAELHPAVKVADQRAAQGEAWTLLGGPPLNGWAGQIEDVADVREELRRMRWYAPGHPNHWRLIFVDHWDDLTKQRDAAEDAIRIDLSAVQLPEVLRPTE